jgi:hypothetical protein
MKLQVNFCGEIYKVDPDQPFTIGREGDLVLDEANFHLHRIFLRIEHESGLWWLSNIGSTLSATVSSGQGEMQAWLAPTGRLPLVFPLVGVWFTAGETTYEFDIIITGTPWESTTIEEAGNGYRTLGLVELSSDQRLLVVALAEDVLRHKNRGKGMIPTSVQAAERLGWSLPKFNRKLDYLCKKLADSGVRGLHGSPGRLAMSRRARLVEFCLGNQSIGEADLDLLPEVRRAPVV